MAHRIWPLTSLILIALGILILAAPARFEGRELVPISPGHALSVLDSLALVPLLAGSAWFYVGFWQRRRRFLEVMRQSPGRTGLGLFVAGLGNGLLVASSFSTFWWWWAIGAALFGLMLLMAAFALADG